MNISKKDKSIIIKFIFFLIFIALILYIAVRIFPWVIDTVKNPVDVREYILSYGIFGGTLFFIIQLIHVIIAVIPGDMLYVLGGFVFGLPVGFLLSYFGVLVGSVLVFYLSRLLGYDFVNRFIPHKMVEKISNILNSAKGMIGLFIVCLIPIIPKDPLMYVAGLTPIKATRLFSVYAVSRIPVTFMWVNVGANAYEKNYLQVGIFIGAIFILALISLFVQKKMMKKWSKKENSIEHKA